MSIKEKIFNSLHQNLVETFPFYASKEVVLCPVCFTEITKEDVFKGALEHIIAENIIRNDCDEAKITTTNQRCGLTVLCRKPRFWGGKSSISMDGQTFNVMLELGNKEAKQGCNGLKGQLYDRLFRGLLDDKQHDSKQISIRHRVAVLMMAYLGAFQLYGYEYILLPSLNQVRDQFDNPDVKITDWLDTVSYFGNLKYPGICSTENGFPFVVGGILQDNAPLKISFRRFRVELPSGYQFVNNPPNLQNLFFDL